MSRVFGNHDKGDARVCHASRWIRREVRGWGGTSRARLPVTAPRSVDEVVDAVSRSGGGSILPFGAGRSYGDNAVNSTGSAISTESLKQIESFDEATGEIICQSGVTYRDILNAYLQSGFVVPVSPGTSYASIGGCIANDVHGKNHDKDGSLGRHINWIEIVLADGSVVRASPDENHDLFNATLGGIGLTGVITRASLTLKNLHGNSVLVKEERIRDLDKFLERLEDSRNEYTYQVGWIDGLKRGNGLGRGVLELAESADSFVEDDRLVSLGVPFDLPSATLNKFTVAAFNAVYYRRIPRAGRESIVSYDRFTYPLDTIRDWNRVYGKRGFYQFQCVLPSAGVARGMRLILETISKTRAASFLAVIKTLGDGTDGMLSFPMRGYTLALDIPKKHRTLEMLRELEEITLLHDGRIYLAKDATLSPAGFRTMYPRHAEFCKVRNRIDPLSRFASDMSRRLELNA